MNVKTLTSLNCVSKQPRGIGASLPSDVKQPASIAAPFAPPSPGGGATPQDGRTMLHVADTLPTT